MPLGARIDLILGSGIVLEARGSHRLKGVPDEWALHQVTSVP